jgi:hypothetical protein
MPNPQVEFNVSRCAELYPCVVGSAGTFVTGPRGFTLNKPAVGVYEVFHHFGDLNYMPLVSPTDTAALKASCTISSRTVDKVVVACFDSGVAADISFMLLIYRL